MGRYRKKPVVVEATQWFKNGDHPDDECAAVQRTSLVDPSDVGEPFLSEGSVVRYFRHPSYSGTSTCSHCGTVMHEHGWIDTLEGERYPCKPYIFAETYEEAVWTYEESS